MKDEILLPRFIKQADLYKYVGMKRTKINEMVLAGEFPKPMFLGEGRGKYWVEAEIRDWQLKMMAQRNAVEAVQQITKAKAAKKKKVKA